MEFLKAIKSIQNKNARKKGTKAYYSSGKIFFSKLFAYQREGDFYTPIPKYAEAIKMIFQMLIAGETLPAIKAKLDSNGFRDSSNNKYTIDRVASVVRPIYSGYLKQGLSYSRVDNVTAIVSLEDYKKARKNLNRELSKLSEFS